LRVLLGTELTRVNRLTGDVYSPRIDECWLNSWRAEEQVEPTRYQICVHGRLSERLAAALEGMTLHSGPVNTVFTGEVKDQSQLYGLLDRLRDLGLELISVQPEAEGARNTPQDQTSVRESAERPKSAVCQPFLVRPSHRSHDAAVNTETQP
jgi:hypothetical protein